LLLPVLPLSNIVHFQAAILQHHQQAAAVSNGATVAGFDYNQLLLAAAAQQQHVNANQTSIASFAGAGYGMQCRKLIDKLCTL
jgi:hypothetical protein